MLNVIAVAGRSGAQTPARQGDLPVSMRSVLGAQLNRDGPDRVVALLGPTSVRDTGDAGGATRVWCYLVGNPSPGSVVEFAANREMAGDQFEADEIRVTRRNPTRNGERCAASEHAGAPSTPGGLRLGLSERQVVRLLGKPVVRGGDSLYYAWESAKALPRRDPNYAYWNSRRKECFGGKAPYTNVGGEITVRLDSLGVYQFVLSRGENAIC